MTLRAVSVAALLLALTGCSSDPGIPVNDRQTLVMESTVLAAGITADKPDFSSSDIQPVAVSRLYNERGKAIKVNYRFYWYDAKGLEMHPLEQSRSIMVPPHSSVAIGSSGNFMGAHKVRLNIWL
jgi:uncharacterized protein YcfL